MQVQQFVDVYIDNGRAFKLLDLLQCEKIHIVGGVDRLRRAKDTVGYRYPSSEEG